MTQKQAITQKKGVIRMMVDRQVEMGRCIVKRGMKQMKGGDGELLFAEVRF